MGQFQPNWEYFWVPAYGQSGWTIGFYGAGLDPIPANLKEVYSNQSQATPIANPVELDVDGKCSVVLGEGGYKVVVRDPEDVVQDTKDNVSNSSGGTPGSETAFVQTIEDLRNWTNYSGSVYVGGYYLAEDGGEGMFYWDGSSSQSDDGGYVIAPASAPFAGRWLRIPDEAQVVRSAAFGAVGTSENRTAEMINADQYAANLELELLINVPVTVGTMTFTSPLVKRAEGAYLRGVSAVTSTYTFSGVFEGGYDLAFDNTVGTVNVVFSSKQVSNPYWFGASPANTAGTNEAAFARWKAAGGGFMVLPPGTWRTESGFTPSSTIPIRYDGKITLADGTSVTNETGAYYPDALSKLHIGVVEFPNNQLFFSSGEAINALTDFGVGRNLDVDGSATIGLTLNAGKWVEAGDTAGQPGYLRARAGTGSAYFRASGALYSAYGSPPPNYTIPGNSILNANDVVQIIAAGTKTAGTESTQIEVRIGGTAAFFFSGSSDMTQWYINVRCVRTGAATLACYGFLISNTTTVGVDIANIPKDLSADQVVSVNMVVGGGGSATLKNLDVSIVPKH
jgi:hypothetical protein